MTVQPKPSPTVAVNVVRQWEEGGLLVPNRDDVLPWELAVQHMAEADLIWQVTQRPDTQAHVRPVFAVETDGMLCSTTSIGARKTILLEQHPRCSFATSTDGIDLVYEGVAVHVREHDHWSGSPRHITTNTAGPWPSPAMAHSTPPLAHPPPALRPTGSTRSNQSRSGASEPTSATPRARLAGTSTARLQAT